jgi:hypothetical protein
MPLVIGGPTGVEQIQSFDGADVHCCAKAANDRDGNGFITFH